VYRVIPDTAVLDQIAALPARVLPQLAEAFSVPELPPQSGRPYNEDLPDGPMRELIFGTNGEAAITYLIVEHVHEVHSVDRLSHQHLPAT
jgi:hypothetical protein